MTRGNKMKINKPNYIPKEQMFNILKELRQVEK